MSPRRSSDGLTAQQKRLLRALARGTSRGKGCAVLLLALLSCAVILVSLAMMLNPLSTSSGHNVCMEKWLTVRQ